MRRLVCLVFALLAVAPVAQPLTVEQIMQRPEAWIGGWPSNVHWTLDGRQVQFSWNPQGRYDADSLFAVGADGGAPARVIVPGAPRYDPSDRRAMSPDGARRAGARDGDVFVTDTRTGETTRLTRTADDEDAPAWLADGRLAYVRTPSGGGPPQLVALDLATGATEQLTALRAGAAPTPAARSAAESLLAAEQRGLFGTLRERARRDSLRTARRDASRRAEAPPPVWLGTDTAEGLTVDPSGRFVTFRRRAATTPTPTRLLAAVTASGYAEAIEARPKIGEPDQPAPLFVTDLRRDTTYAVDLTSLPGADSSRVLTAWGPLWSPDGRRAVIDVRTRDNHHRWVATLDAATSTVAVLDHQRDAAWLGGPGVSSWGDPSPMGWMPDGRLWLETEATGWTHLAAVDVGTGRVEALTDGAFEVADVVLAPDGRSWLFGSSEGDAGQWHLWTMPVAAPGAAAEAFAARRRRTSLVGRWDAAVAPDGQHVAFLYSASNRPPEVYLARLDALERGEAPAQVTDSPTAAWRAMDWPEAELVTVPASDGAAVPARIYRPEAYGAAANGAAVLFVHGAGYLQNAHRGWSSYFREWMFHRLLAERGYVVLDLDYRASAGYGRDWRTAIAGHMGGRDLQDYVDASRWLTATRGIAPERVGLYGGSYGGFLTLMALFTEGEHFGAGAALRSVTDWAHYNDGYTRNILGDPVTDADAYRRSSPITFADGLADPLLMIHGLVDDKVQPQDIFRLSQRLIELGKMDWELAIHPVEAHGYTEPSSWTDAYRRILALFERTVGAPR